MVVSPDYSFDPVCVLRYYDERGQVIWESWEATEKAAAEACRLIQGKQSEASYVEIDEGGLKREATDLELEATAIKIDTADVVGKLL